MKVRIRKANPGETPGFKNKLKGIIQKAENGGEATAMMDTLVKASYKLLVTEQAEPEQIYKNLLNQKIEPQLAMEIIRRAAALAEEDESIKPQGEDINNQIEQEEAATRAKIEEAAAKQAEWEKLKMYNEEQSNELFNQDQQAYIDSQAQNEAIDEEDDLQSEEDFNDMLFSEPEEQKYGGLTKAQFGYDFVNKGNEGTPKLTEDQLVDTVFDLYKGNESAIPSEIDSLIAQTPGIQNIYFSGIEEYIPQYDPYRLYDSYQVPNPFDEEMMMKKGGMTKKAFVNHMMKKYEEGGQEENPEEEQPGSKTTPLDTFQNNDVAKLKNGFLDSIRMTAKRKAFGDFWDNASPEIKNLDFIKNQMDQQPMAQNGYMVPENDFTHYTHGADDIFNQQLNEYVGQTGGFVSPDMNENLMGDSLAKFTTGGPDYMDKNTADPYSKAQFPSYGKYGVSVGNIKMTRGGMGPGGKNPDEVTEDTSGSLDPVELAQTLGIKNLPTANMPIDPYDIITDERVNYKYVPTSGGRIGLMDALLPWNPFRSYQRYNMQIPIDQLLSMQNLNLGREQYPWYSIRNLDNVNLFGNRRLLKKLQEQIDKLQKGDNEITIDDLAKKVSVNDVKNYFGETDSSWRKLSQKNKKGLKYAYKDFLERQVNNYLLSKNMDDEDLGEEETINEPMLQDEYYYNEPAYTPYSYVTPIYDTGGESRKCPEGYKKDPISGMCRDDAGNTVFPTFTPSSTLNFSNFQKEGDSNVGGLQNNMNENKPTEMFGSSSASNKMTLDEEPPTKMKTLEPSLLPTKESPEKLEGDPKIQKYLNLSGKVRTTDYESGINQFQLGKNLFANMIGNRGNDKRAKQMIMDNANIMNLVSRTPMLDKGDHNELGSGYGQFREYGPEQQARGAYGKTGGTFKRGGSKVEYNIGDELYMTEAEIADFIKNGGKLEFV